MKAPETTELDPIGREIRLEGRRLRRMTLQWVGILIAAGTIILGGLALAMNRLSGERAELASQKEDLVAVGGRLREEVAQLEKDREDLQRREAILETYRGDLPEEALLLESGLAEEESGNYEAAKKSYDQALELARPQSLPQEKVNQETLRELEAQRDRLNQEIDQQTEADQQTRQELLSKEQEISKARRQLLALRLKSETVHKQAVQSVVKEDDLDAGIRGYEQALDLDPENRQALNHLGYARYRKGEYKLAVEALRKAIALPPGKSTVRPAEAHYNLALSLWNLEQRDEALSVLEEGLRIDPSYEALIRVDPAYKELGAYRKRNRKR